MSDYALDLKQFSWILFQAEQTSRRRGAETKIFHSVNWRWGWWNWSELSCAVLKTEFGEMVDSESEREVHMMKHGDSSLTQCHRGDSALRAEFANTQLCGGGGRQTERQVDRLSSGSVRGSPSALLQRPECCDSDLLSSYSPLRLCALTHQLSKWRGITKTLRISVSTPPPPPPSTSLPQVSPRMAAFLSQNWSKAAQNLSGVSCHHQY